MLATDGPKGHLRKISRLTKSFEKNSAKKLPILFPGCAGEQRVARKSREVYWKAPERLSVLLRVVTRVRSSDYESAALTI
jgi:hypothetical protein